MASFNYSRLFDAAGTLHTLLPSLLRSTRAFPPMFVQIEVTHRCNAACPMCYQGDRLGTEGELTTEEIRRVIDQLPPGCVLSLTGGEPFLREDLGSLLEYGMRRRRCSLLTNASRVTDDHVDLIARNRLLLFAVSIDGIGETHDRIRRVPGLFSRATETVAKIRERKRKLGTAFPLVDIKTVILKENLHQLHDILELAGRLSADYVTYSVSRTTDNLYGPPYRDDLGDIRRAPPRHPRLEPDEIALLERQLARIRTHAGKPRVRIYPGNLLEGGRLGMFYRRELAPADFLPCRKPWSRMSVSPHGDVYPCLAYRVGNVRRESLPRIWNGERFREFRSILDRHRLPDFCLGCCNSDGRPCADGG